MRRSSAALLALGAAAVILSGCGTSTYTWGWYVILPFAPKGQSNLQFLLSGLWATLSLSLAAIACSTVLGILVALPGLSKNRYARAFNRIYVEGFRAIPLLVLVLWVYYGLPVVLDLQLGVFAAGLVSLALSDSAFEAEIFRGGIQSVERGQVEAAMSLGLKYWPLMRFIVLPQAIRSILPALGNQFVYMLKMSSIISVIGYQELTRRANELTVTEYRPLEIYTFLVLEYLVLIVIASYLVRRLEKRLAAGTAR
jgi:His/Glu/Gln/Arg/opine family amino acid ABC transporter permease subunit